MVCQDGSRGYLEHLNDIIALYSNMDLVESLGCMTKGALPKGERWTVDHPVVRDQDEMCENAANMISCTLARRLRTLIWFQNFPGGFSVFAGPHPDAQQVMLNSMKEFDMNQETIHNGKGAFWKKLKLRSPHSLMIVKQIFALSRSVCWMVGADDTMQLRVTCRSQLNCISQSKLIEDGVRDERVEEQSRRSFNTKMSGERCWINL